jgi:valyl-tRNA synthetase
MKGLETKLQNEDFTRKAPKDIVQKEKSRYKELVDRKKRLQENIKILTS